MVPTGGKYPAVRFERALEVLSKPLAKSRKTVGEHRDLDLIPPTKATIVAERQGHRTGRRGAAGFVLAVGRPSHRAGAAGGQMEHFLDQLLDPFELAAAAGQHDRARRPGGQQFAMFVQAVPGERQYLLDPGTHDLGDTGAWYLAGGQLGVVPEARMLDARALVAAAKLGAAEQIS